MALLYRRCLADYSNHVIRFVSLAGVLSITAGGVLGTAGWAGDGTPATSAAVRLSQPMGIVYQSGGGLVVRDLYNMITLLVHRCIHCPICCTSQWSEQGNTCIRYVSAGGIISTSESTSQLQGDNESKEPIIPAPFAVANVQRSNGATGDGGFAVLAKLWNPTVAADGLGGYIISDGEGSLVIRGAASATRRTRFLVPASTYSQQQRAAAALPSNPVSDRDAVPDAISDAECIDDSHRHPHAERHPDAHCERDPDSFRHRIRDLHSITDPVTLVHAVQNWHRQCFAHAVAHWLRVDVGHGIAYDLCYAHADPVQHAHVVVDRNSVRDLDNIASADSERYDLS